MLTKVHPQSLRWQLFIICPLKFSFMNCIPAALDTSLLFINAENHANDVDLSTATRLLPRVAMKHISSDHLILVFNFYLFLLCNSSNLQKICKNCTKEFPNYFIQITKLLTFYHFLSPSSLSVYIHIFHSFIHSLDLFTLLSVNILNIFSFSWLLHNTAMTMIFTSPFIHERGFL